MAHAEPFAARVREALAPRAGGTLGGFVLVALEGRADDADLQRWVGAGAERAAEPPPKG